MTHNRIVGRYNVTMRKIKSNLKLLVVVIGIAFIVLTLAAMDKLRAIWRKD